MRTETNHHTVTLDATMPGGGVLVPDFVTALPPILMADDDPDDLFFVVRLVKRTGTTHPLITFDDGMGLADYFSRGWLTGAQAEPQVPRLLFLDLKMAGLGGFAFLEWLAARPGLAPVHVVILSGSVEPEDIRRAKALGAKRYLAKHPSVATFARIIAHVYGPSAVVPDYQRNGHVAADFFEEALSDRRRSQAG